MRIHERSALLRMAFFHSCSLRRLQACWPFFSFRIATRVTSVVHLDFEQGRFWKIFSTFFQAEMPEKPASFSPVAPLRRFQALGMSVFWLSLACPRKCFTSGYSGLSRVLKHIDCYPLRIPFFAQGFRVPTRVLKVVYQTCIASTSRIPCAFSHAEPRALSPCNQLCFSLTLPRTTAIFPLFKAFEEFPASSFYFLLIN